jgi:tRNA-2-methylthio-N6-dimethylallyladenosine synthase
MPQNEPIMKLCLRTFGCQMNKRDSEIILSMLADDGYVRVDREDDADVILFNTCCVRAHAEQRVYSRMQQLAKLKGRRPELILGIGGCMAQKEGHRIVERLPHVDLVFGTGVLYELPELLRRAIADGGPVIAVDERTRPMRSQAEFGLRERGVRAWISIGEGCDNRCAYCVVPMVRGPERSKPPELILDEVRCAIERGYTEIFLLGQNVNSYGHDLVSAPDFAGLLELVNEVPGVRRIRFTTSHPKDMSPRLVEVIRDLPRVCEHLHLPVQSGSSRILALMNRGYARGDYLDKIELVRSAVPDIGLTTDVIVGFPGETEDDFDETRSLLEQVRFDTAYIFKFSPRDGTSGEALPNSVPQHIIVHRHRMLLEIEKEISRARMGELVGTKQEVLVEELCKQEPEYIVGRTRSYRVVRVRSDGAQVGDEVEVDVTGVRGWTLYGTRVKDTPRGVSARTCARVIIDS